MESITQLAKRKVEELESAENTSSATKKPLWTCTEQDQKTGMAAINGFLQEFKSIGHSPTLEEIEELQLKYKDSFETNPFVLESLKQTKGFFTLNQTMF